MGTCSPAGSGSLVTEIKETWSRGLAHWLSPHAVYNLLAVAPARAQRRDQGHVVKETGALLVFATDALLVAAVWEGLAVPRIARAGAQSWHACGKRSGVPASLGTLCCVLCGAAVQPPSACGCCSRPSAMAASPAATRMCDMGLYGSHVWHAHVCAYPRLGVRPVVQSRRGQCEQVP